MKNHVYKLKRLFFSGKLCKISLFGMLVTFAIAVGAFVYCKKYGASAHPLFEFIWQSSLGIFAGIFVGYMVDAVDGYNKIKYISTILSAITIENQLPVYLANLPGVSQGDSKYKLTGPGETIAIGLLYGAYSTLFSTSGRPAYTGQIVIRNSKDFDEITVEDTGEQKLIFGGPRYNHLTKKLLEDRAINIQFLKDDKGDYRHGLKQKEGSFYCECAPGAKEQTKLDYGLIIKRGKLLHISGCRTWGVIGAATCIFSEASAGLLVQQLGEKKINPVTGDYLAVISCKVPDANNDYSIGELTVIHVRPIAS